MVQVTDDTSQHIWCIRGADLTFVPSLKTKVLLKHYADKHKMNLMFEVAPYPLCPILTKELENIEERVKVYSSNKKQINVAVPISGAAVGLSFITRLISNVVKKSDRFKFWVLVKSSIYTDFFLTNLAKLPNVKLITGRNDNEMISLYELLYQNNLMHLEITKPSEQSFKAILPPSLVGGSILLFTSPVGRQEYENIDFLVRQGLMPRSTYDISGSPNYTTSNFPRAIRLSKDPQIASNFIIWGHESGLFSKLSSSEFRYSDQAIASEEIGPDGAYKFWDLVMKHFG